MLNDDKWAAMRAAMDQALGDLKQFAELIGNYRQLMLEQGFSTDAAERMATDWHWAMVTRSGD